MNNSKYKPIFYFSIFLTAFLLLFSCSTTYHVKMMKPAEINLGGIKRVAVMDFDFTGDWDFDIEEKESSFTDAIKDAIIRKISRPSKSKRMPHPKRAFPGSEVSQAYVTYLVNNRHYSVAERQKLKDIMKEQKLSLSGAVDENTAARIGKLLGVDALIMGSGNYYVKDMGQLEEKPRKDKKGKVIKDSNGDPVMEVFYKAMRLVDISVTYRIVNVSTGEIMASKSNSYRNYSGSKSNPRCHDYTYAKTKEEAVDRLPPWRPIVKRGVNSIASISVKQIAPHYVTRARKVENGKTDQMKNAIKYVKRNMWDEAKELWETVLQSNHKDAVKDHVAARYNIGVYYEINGNLDKAEEYFGQCFKDSGDSKYLDAKANIKYRRKELEELEKQQN